MPVRAAPMRPDPSKAPVAHKAPGSNFCSSAFAVFDAKFDAAVTSLAATGDDEAMPSLQPDAEA
jgi:hypothetical protein